ncbi:MAG: OmpH/Skp family outer membrane protein [Desulfobaccales bacterium]
MKRLASVLVGLLLLTSIACTGEPPKIGVVDVVRVINDSNEGKKANAEVNALVQAKQATLKKKVEAVEKLKKGLERETPKGKKDDFNKAAVEYQKLVAAADEEVKKKAAELRKVVLDHIRKVLDTIGQEEKFLLILTNENVGYSQKSIDITDKVIKKYDELQGGK